MDRYITIKRKLSHKNCDTENKPKNIRDNNTNNKAPANNNRFALLADTKEDLDNESKKIKPPPIYIREKSTNGLVNSLIKINLQ